MTVNEAYKKGIEILKNAGREAPANDAGVLLCYATGCDRSFIYAHGSDELGDLQQKDFLALLERRATGEPLQYLTGVQEFMSLNFIVGPGVLVPRQETELLVETIISLNKEGKWIREVLDIGTGSGCIAVSLAHYMPGCRVTAVDKMQDALDIAGRNAVINGVGERVEFIRSNLFEAMPGRKFDVIVSNPPYIRSGDIDNLQEEVRCHEPMEALDGGVDGLDFYREIIKYAPKHLRDRGALVFETGYDQASDVAELMTSEFYKIKIYKDLGDVDRVVAGTCKQNK